MPDGRWLPSCIDPGILEKEQKRQPGEREGLVSPPEDPAPDPSGFKGSLNVTYRENKDLLQQPELEGGEEILG